MGKVIQLVRLRGKKAAVHAATDRLRRQFQDMLNVRVCVDTALLEAAQRDIADGLRISVVPMGLSDGRH